MKVKFSSFSVIIVFVTLAVIGASLIPLLSVQLTPSPSSSSIHVSFSWHNASAKVIEQEVTSKLEGLFNGIQEVEELSSSSRKGSGSISIKFKENTNMDAARFEMANLLRQVYPKLPVGVSYPMLSRNVASQNASPILTYKINANQSPYFIRKYADEHIVPRLAVLEGVAQVDVFGASAYEWVITYNADLLFQLQLSVSDLRAAITSSLGETELGKARLASIDDSGPNEIAVSLHFQKYEKPRWKSIPIKKVGDRLITLGDVASVRFQEGPVTAYHRINGLNTLNMVLYPESGVNTLSLAADLKEAVKEIEKGISMQYQLDLTSDPTAHLQEELNKIQLRSFFSLLILMVLAIVVYRNLKYLSILFLSIFMNLLIAMILYYLLEVDLQLYSFAGITISFGIIIDNTIIMLDHLRSKGNKKAFLAILAATLTTIGALFVIFLLEEQQRANLWDFALVILINLAVSLLVALYLIPALLDKLKVKKLQKNTRIKFRKRKARLNRGYYAFLVFLRKPFMKTSLIIVLVLAFGLPLHLAPNEMEEKGVLSEVYNKTLGGKWFRETIRPSLELIIGGSLRLFTEEVVEKSFYQEPSRTRLSVSGRMPDGSTIEQLNEHVMLMERYLASFDEIELFETSIYSYRYSNISIYFKEEYENTGFPYTLKSLLEIKAISFDGLDWTITGVGRGFSNALGQGGKTSSIELTGYNYDQLYAYAEMLKKRLLEKSNGRIREIEINSGNRYGSSPMYEFHLDFDPELMAMAEVGERDFHQALSNKLHSGNLTTIINDRELQQVKLISDQSLSMNIWDLNNAPLTIQDKEYKLGQLARISKKKSGNMISKENQQYRLGVAYDFIGPYALAHRFMEQQVEWLSEILPIGYKVAPPGYMSWNKEDQKQYYLIFVVVLVIFFISAILLESIKQPLAIISVIPVSFIGVFLTFYLLDYNFDQGGYASFVLLSGVSVNAALYIINDFNNLRKAHPHLNILRGYLKAFNQKIIPILLTIISTMAGLAPFIWAGQKEPFWFSFAVGSLGGLTFSLLGLLLYLPIFVVPRKRT